MSELYIPPKPLSSRSEILPCADKSQSPPDPVYTNMVHLCEQGVQDFSPAGLRKIHRALFRGTKDQAGQYRTVNIDRPEILLSGRSVWYSNKNSISEDLCTAFERLSHVPWGELSREAFIQQVARLFSGIWQVHPFLEGNTQAIVLMMIFFVERHGLYIDYELLASNAAHLRDAFVMASLDQFSEFAFLERILLDAVCSAPVSYSENSLCD